MKLLAFLAWGFFLTCAMVFLSNYGTQWTLGRYLTPVSLIAPNGVSHPDGSPVDGFTLALVRAGIQEEASLAFWGGLLLLLAYVIRMSRQLHAAKRALVQAQREGRELLRQLQ